MKYSINFEFVCVFFDFKLPKILKIKRIFYEIQSFFILGGF